MGRGRQLFDPHGDRGQPAERRSRHHAVRGRSPGALRGDDRRGRGAVHRPRACGTAASSSSAWAPSGSTPCRAARLAKAKHVVAIDTNPAKEEVARRFGATAFLNPRQIEGPLDKAVKELLGGLADYAFECVGNVDLLPQAPGPGSALLGRLHRGRHRTVRPERSPCRPPPSGSGAPCAAPSSATATPITDTRKIIDWYGSGELKIDELVTPPLSPSTASTRGSR